MGKLVSGLGHIHGAVKWIMVALTSMAAIIGLLVNARSLGLTPWLGLAGGGLSDIAARRVVVSPSQDTLTAIGDSLQLAATITDERGATIAGATLLWASDDSGVATVDSTGAVVARGPGAATVTASVRDHAGHARVVVAQRVRSVTIVRDTLVRLPEGGTQQLLARAHDARGRLVAGRTVHWQSADTTIVAITPAGLATAGAPGQTTLTASIEGQAASIPAEVTLAPATARLLAGADQRTGAGRRLPDAVAVEVLSRGGRPVPGAAVSFATEDPQGKVDPATATTDRNGRAEVVWTLGPQAGRQHLSARVAGLDTTVVITAEADPVRANTRIQQAGDALQGQVGAALAAPVGVRVTDSVGAAVADVPVAWQAADGGTVQALGPRTDSLGEAWAHWTLGRRAGAQHVRVQVGNPRTMPPVTVTATAVAEPAAAVVIESGADQQGAAGAALRRAVVARLTDRDGNAAAGATVRVQAADGTVPDTVLVADQRGRVSVRWTLGRQAGTQRLELRLGDAPPVQVTARARPLEPANVAPLGAPLSGAAGRALQRPMVFEVTDAYGNPTPDVQVVFSTTSGAVAPGRVMTDAKGQAATRWTLGPEAGDLTLRATVRGTAVKGSVTVRAVKPAVRR